MERVDAGEHVELRDHEPGEAVDPRGVLAAPPGRASRCAARGRWWCRTRRPPRGSARRARRRARWGTGPAPTRVVYALAMPHTSSSAPGPTPAPGPAAAATVFDEVTNGYVPWSMSSSAPCAPSKTTSPPSSSASPRDRRRVRDERLEPVAVGAVLLGHRVQVELGELGVRPEHQPLGLHRRVDLLAEDVLVEQVLHPDAEPGRLVRVAGADAAPGRADLELPELGLALLVEELVVRHDQVRVGRDAQAAEVDPPPAQLVDLLAQHDAGPPPRRSRSRTACRGRGSPTGSGGT